MSTAVASRGQLRRGWGVMTSILHRWLVLALGVAAWELGTRATTSPYFPTPTKIVARMYHLWFSGPISHVFLTSTAVQNILPSLGRMAVGLAASVVVGVTVGLALGRSQRAFEYLDPLLQFARVIPPPTLVPIFIVLFSVGTQMQLASIIFSAIWPILLNTADGARSVDPLQMDTARVFRLSPDRPAPEDHHSVLAAEDLRRAAPQPVAVTHLDGLLRAPARDGQRDRLRARRRAEPLGPADDVGRHRPAGHPGLPPEQLLLMVERRLLAWHRTSHTDR